MTQELVAELQELEIERDGSEIDPAEYFIVEPHVLGLAGWMLVVPEQRSGPMFDAYMELGAIHMHIEADIREAMETGVGLVVCHWRWSREYLDYVPHFDKLEPGTTKDHRGRVCDCLQIVPGSHCRARLPVLIRSARPVSWGRVVRRKAVVR